MIKKRVIAGCVLAFLAMPWGSPTLAKDRREKPARTVMDVDEDGYSSRRDCDDLDKLTYPGAAEICGDGIDQDCNGEDLACSCTDFDKDGYAAEDADCGPADCNDNDLSIHPDAFEAACGDIDRNCDGNVGPVCQSPCTDSDEDGYALEGGGCGAVDCNDADSSVYPGATEICGDSIDQDCSNADLACSGGGDPSDPHGALVYQDYPLNCLGCHSAEAAQMSGSTHYRWVGEATEMVNNPGAEQGKLTNAVNSYCISIKGDWPVCGSCHVGRGKKPDDSDAGPENIDCLACHNEEYATARKRLADGSMGVEAPVDSMVQNIHAPTRINCLQCHAKAGGGDGVKRGDLSLATGTSSDPDFDVHMNKTGSDLSCQKCHAFEEHKVIGKGSDLRPTDDVVRGAEIKCTTCHGGKDSFAGHDNEDIGRHVARVACQSCHIPTYAKVATEIHRDWTKHHDGSAADGLTGPGHPLTVKADNLIPEYMFWNRMSDNALLQDDASITYDAVDGTYPTSRPVGDIEDGMLYPFKYKTASQPITVKDNRLIALDTFEYLKVSGDADTAIKSGLQNMGYSADEPYTWINTDTYQLLNHGVNPASSALQCSSCHGNTARMDLQNELGYGLKGSQSTVCTQCHGIKDQKPFATIHDKHVKDKGYDCSNCHNFSRPERDLRVRG